MSDSEQFKPNHDGGKINQNTNIIGYNDKDQKCKQDSKDIPFNDSDSDDDFGAFSDASFEDDKISSSDEKNSNISDSAVTPSDNKKTDTVEDCLDILFGKNTGDINDLNMQNTENVSCDPNDLLKEERPHIIYEQLVNGAITTEPFIWNKSHLKSTTLHILGIDEDQYNKNKVNKGSHINETLDDSLFLKLCSLTDIDKNNNNGNKMILRDNFRYKYTPLIHQPGSLQEETDKDRELLIPNLLDWDENIATDSTDNAINIKEYHDKLCNQIDSLFTTLKELNQKQIELINDKTTFENVVTNLSGHTQRLQRDEIALYNKKMKRKIGRGHVSTKQWKTLNWVGL